MKNKIFDFTLGIVILLFFYFISLGILHLVRIQFPPAILGLILLAVTLISGIVKEDWIKAPAEWLINNMAMFLLPFIAGLVAYQSMLIKNLIPILLVIFVTTTVIIVLTGLFIEYGTAFVRLHHRRKANHD
jgi:holin-like protein